MTQTSFEFTIQPNQLWSLDGANYRIVTVENGKAKLLALFGFMGFKWMDCPELIEKGSLQSEDHTKPF